MLLIEDVDLPIHEFYFFPRQSDDALDIKVLGIVGRSENDDVSSFRRTISVAEKGIVDGFVHDEVFTEAIPTPAVNFIESVAHGRAKDLEWRNEISAHRVDENHDDHDVYQKVPEEVEGGMFFLQVIKPEPFFSFFGFKHACYT